jgi:hypothetical protein
VVWLLLQNSRVDFLRLGEFALPMQCHAFTELRLHNRFTINHFLYRIAIPLCRRLPSAIYPNCVAFPKAAASVILEII